MKNYPQQFEPWRPDYPPVWNGILGDYARDFKGKPKTFDLLSRNLIAFDQAKQEIIKAMRL